MRLQVAPLWNGARMRAAAHTDVFTHTNTHGWPRCTAGRLDLRVRVPLQNLSSCIWPIWRGLSVLPELGRRRASADAGCARVGSQVRRVCERGTAWRRRRVGSGNIVLCKDRAVVHVGVIHPSGVADSGVAERRRRLIERTCMRRVDQRRRDTLLLALRNGDVERLWLSYLPAIAASMRPHYWRGIIGSEVDDLRSLRHSRLRERLRWCINISSVLWLWLRICVHVTVNTAIAPNITPARRPAGRPRGCGSWFLRFVVEEREEVGLPRSRG